MNRLDRRALFTSGAAAALLAATGTSVHGAPKSGGTLRLALPRDGCMMADLARWASHDALVEIGPDGVLRSELAVAWRSDATARKWWFDLRGDAQFLSGRDVSVLDVVASLNRGLDGVAAVEAEGPDRIAITLGSANPQFPYLLASADFAITEGGVTLAALDQNTGSGCYQITRANADRDFRAERRRDHYKSAVSGWFGAVEVAVIPDPKIRAEALRDGFVDVAAFPAAQILRDRRDLTFHPSIEDMQLVAHHGVGVPRVIGRAAALDDARLLERWWMV